ncbi:MAG: OsmC family protein [Lentimicrobiaceae bacterium]|nr:OsmC family protein [Lentimicrobiaceae bacterium]
MAESININWQGDMSFDAVVNGHHIVLDAVAAVGGKDQGPRPKPLILVALAGCTGMDVVSILDKMRVKPDALNIEVEGELTEEHPRYYHKLHIIYHFTGQDLPVDKLEKAIQLSQERYCGVTAMLQKAAVITHEIRLNPS